MLVAIKGDAYCPTHFLTHKQQKSTHKEDTHTHTHTNQQQTEQKSTRTGLITILCVSGCMRPFTSSRQFSTAGSMRLLCACFEGSVFGSVRSAAENVRVFMCKSVHLSTRVSMCVCSTRQLQANNSRELHTPEGVGHEDARGHGVDVPDPLELLLALHSVGFGEPQLCSLHAWKRTCAYW